MERIEAVLVAVFGAFVAGDFVPAMLGRPASGAGVFSLSSLLLSGAGAVGLMVLLKVMRRVVGPLRPGKSPTRGRR